MDYFFYSLYFMLQLTHRSYNWLTLDHLLWHSFGCSVLHIQTLAAEFRERKECRACEYNYTYIKKAIASAIW